ncbi:unnamed protein product, partial [Nesidiocoris tenuis]
MHFILDVSCYRILWMHKEWYYKYKGETPPVHPTGTEIMTRQGSQTAPAPSTA